MRREPAISYRFGPPGGERGIRTRGTRKGTLDFESSTFGRSVSSPPRNLPKVSGVSIRRLSEITLQVVAAPAGALAPGLGKVISTSLLSARLKNQRCFALENNA
jgi:hypothetical protein